MLFPSLKLKHSWLETLLGEWFVESKRELCRVLNPFSTGLAVDSAGFQSERIAPDEVLFRDYRDKFLKLGYKERLSLMARFMRLDVITAILESGVLPLFYHGEVEAAIELVSACAKGGAHAVEFTNRGELAYPVFSELVRYFSKADPAIILGVGSIIDAPTAALFIAAGANFIVGPSLNPEISRLCNRRKILYMPGCATENEISSAEELGAEICKIFPGDSVGGPGFIKAVMAPCPWHRLLPTGGVDASAASISEWIKAGAAAVGLGSKLISPQAVKSKDYAGVAAKTAQCIGWVKAARAG